MSDTINDVVPARPEKSIYIGLIMGITTHTIFGVVDPGHDYELDNPRLLQVRVDPAEAVTLVKVKRDEYEDLNGPDDVQRMIINYYCRKALSGEAPGGTEYLDPMA